jgi:hypothetical protein
MLYMGKSEFNIEHQITERTVNRGRKFKAVLARNNIHKIIKKLVYYKL